MKKLLLGFITLTFLLPSYNLFAGRFGETFGGVVAGTVVGGMLTQGIQHDRSTRASDLRGDINQNARNIRMLDEEIMRLKRDIRDLEDEIRRIKK